LQLTNILRDIKDDLERGVSTFRSRTWRRAAAPWTIWRAGVSDPVRRAIAFECRRARDFYDRAAAALPRHDRRRMVAAEIMRAVYFKTLTRIERNGYDVFTTRARVPRLQQALIALRQWMWPA
jgi:phytoene synthase